MAFYFRRFLIVLKSHLKMQPTSVKIGNILLKRHERLCRGFAGLRSEISDRFVDTVTIPYRVLAASAGVNYRRIGVPLREVATWCANSHLPPITSLVISEWWGRPNTKYYDSPGCNCWPDDVRRCITFTLSEILMLAECADF